MSTENAIDLVRWTFTVNPEHKQALETHLVDLGAEVFAGADGQFVVLWDEPEGELDEVVEELWDVAGVSFDVTHETFHRGNLEVYQQEETEEADRAAA